MFEAVRKNKRISQVILAIIIVPFAFFGMDAFFDGSVGSGEVATVGSAKISVREFEQALRQQQERVQRERGGEYDRALFESEVFRRSVLESVINQRVLAVHAAESRMVISPQQLQATIASLPGFQSNGQFSLELYERQVRAEGLTPAMFEAQLNQDMRVQQIVAAVGESAFAGTVPAQRLLLAQLEEREVRELKFEAGPLAQDVVLADNAAKNYYLANPARFERPARLRAEYVVFDAAALRERVTIPEEQVKQFYESNKDRYGQPEERKARHILIQVGSDASDTEVAAAQDKAQQLLTRLRSDPTQFEEIARTESQDSGSAPAGGDLGFFGPGAMVKAFEDAAFGLEVGQISELVRTDFGFHIIEVTAITPESVKPFDEVQAEIADGLAHQEASRKFALDAEKFSNSVYEQPDSLQPAAELLGLEIQTTDWVTREGGRIGRFQNEQLLDALFSAELRSSGENTEAVEAERGALVAARVAEYEAAQTLPFESVQASIEEQLRAEEAGRLARQQGEATLAALAGGQSADGNWSEPQRLQRANPTLPQEAMQAVFGASAKALPTHVGVAMPGGNYSIFELVAVNQPEFKDDDPRVKAIAQQYERLIAEREFKAYISSLRDRYKVQINAAAVRPQGQ